MRKVTVPELTSGPTWAMKVGLWPCSPPSGEGESDVVVGVGTAKVMLPAALGCWSATE